MPENNQNHTLNNHKTLIWCLAIFVLALVVRLIQISDMAFLAADGKLAADALAIARREAIGFGNMPAYSGLTGILMYLFGGSNFIARIIPVLAGSSLVLLPFLIMKGKKPVLAIIFALGLALDPFMVTMSRQVTTPLLAFAGMSWAVYFLHKKKAILTGVFLAIAFLSGAYFWVFLLAFLVWWGITRLFKLEMGIDLRATFSNDKDRIVFIVSFLISLVLISTGFLLKMDGLGQIASGLLAFLKLFSTPYSLPLYHVFFVLLSMSFLPLLAGIIWLIKKGQSAELPTKISSGLFLLIGLLLTLFFSRQDVGASVMVVVPLWFLAAHYLEGLKPDLSNKPGFKIAAFALFVVLMVYVAMSLQRLFQVEFGTPAYLQVGLASLAGMLLILILFWLSSLAFETKQNITIFAWALMLCLFAGTLSQTFNSLEKTNDIVQLSLNHGPILLGNQKQWRALEPFEGYGRLNISEASFLADHIDEDLRWQLRHYQSPVPSKAPEFILSHSQTIPGYEEPYRGMRIEFSKFIPWNRFQFRDYLYNMFIAVNTWHVENAYLWAQTKLFTGANE
mgnify:CR=1 FL=1